MRELNKRCIAMGVLCLVIIAAFVAHSARRDMPFMPFEREEAIEALEALLGKVKEIAVFPLEAQDPVIEMLLYRNDELESVISYLLMPIDVRILDPLSLTLKKDQSEMITFSHQLDVWLEHGGLWAEFSVANCALVVHAEYLHPEVVGKYILRFAYMFVYDSPPPWYDRSCGSGS